MADGRFAPSPTGPLHLGNLRTALLAWLFARAADSRFLVRMEDLDEATARPEHERSQLADLAALGLDWDGPVVRQSERGHLYEEAIARLTEAGLTGRPPALRLRAGGARVTVVDRRHGEFDGVVDDLVLRRNDGTPAYNLAVVVDDAEQGVEQVVRADDLLASTPRHVHLARLLGLTPPGYAHVPLVLAPDGSRLAKRHGAVTIADRGSPSDVLSMLAASVGLASAGERVSAATVLERFDPDKVPSEPWVLQPNQI